VARALRFQGSLPISSWGECVLVTGYLINCTPSRLLNGKIPYEMLFGTLPADDHIKVFGSLCYAHNQGRGVTNLLVEVASMFLWVIHMARKVRSRTIWTPMNNLCDETLCSMTMCFLCYCNTRYSSFVYSRCRQCGK